MCVVPPVIHVGHLALVALVALQGNFINTGLFNAIFRKRQYNCSSSGAGRCCPKPRSRHRNRKETMSPLLATIIFTCVFAASHTAPQEPLQAWTEDVVSYSGFQLWSATPRNQEEREFLLKIRQDYGNEISTFMFTL